MSRSPNQNRTHDRATDRAAAAGAAAVQVDQLARRGPHDVLEGAMAYLHLEDPAVLDAVTEAHGGNLRPGQGHAGVFERPVELEPDGYPRTALVRLRDDSAAAVVVPYKALSPVPDGRAVR